MKGLIVFGLITITVLGLILTSIIECDSAFSYMFRGGLAILSTMPTVVAIAYGLSAAKPKDEAETRPWVKRVVIETSKDNEPINVNVRFENGDVKLHVESGNVHVENGEVHVGNGRHHGNP